MNFESFGSYASHSKVLVSFHGLPGLKSNANRDFLKRLAQEKKMFCILISYPNLTCNSFSFLDDTQRALETLSGVARKYISHEWHVLGHSWGGLVSLMALSNNIISAKKICLLSPFTKFPTNDSVLLEILGRIKEDYPFFLNSKKDLSIYLSEIRQVEKLYNPYVLASKISSTANVYLMQALDDHEVLPQDSKLFLKNFSCEVSYKEFQTDHSFLGRRQEVYEEIRNFFYA